MYLIKSVKWSKCDGIETWYRPKNSGYTTFIASAGLYSEEDMIKKKETDTSSNIEFVPLTKDIIDRGFKQLENERRKEEVNMENARRVYLKSLESSQEYIEKIDSAVGCLNEWKNII